MSQDVREALLRQMESFREKFGRDPGPTDPVFFDPNADEPQPMSFDTIEEELLDAMAAAGVDPALIYAFHKTGRIVSETNQHMLTRSELKEWNDAVEEYRALHPAD
jgi:hypothetical protein